MPEAGHERPGSERRSAAGPLLLAAFRGPEHLVTFDDLAVVAVEHRLRLSQVVGWLTDAKRSGVLEDVGYEEDADRRPVGPRRYRLGHAGVGIRRRDRRRAVGS